MIKWVVAFPSVMIGSIKLGVVFPSLYLVFDGMQLEESNFYSCWLITFLIA
jgi:hypothetical protein